MERTCHLSEQQHPVVESGWSRCCPPPPPPPRPLLLLVYDVDDVDSDADDDDDDEWSGYCPLLLLTACPPRHPISRGSASSECPHQAADGSFFVQIASIPSLQLILILWRVFASWKWGADYVRKCRHVLAAALSL